MRTNDCPCVTIVLCPPFENHDNWTAYVPEYINSGVCVASGKTEEECLLNMYREIRIHCSTIKYCEPKKVLITKYSSVVQMPKRAANEPMKVRHLLVFEGGSR